MRNYFKFAFFAFAMTLVACSTDDGITDGGNNGNETLPVKNAQTFTASLEKNSTRTSSTFSGGTWSTIWTLKDAIKVSGSSVTKSFQIANESDIVNGTTATFTNTSDEKLESTEGFYAVYPDVKGLTLSGNTVTGTIPSMQPLETATGINPNYQIMTGYASENAFEFKNLVSFFKVTIENNTIFKTVKIVSNNNVKIAGDFTATIANAGIPTVSVTENANARTFVEVRSTSALDGTYYLAVLPTAGSVDVTLMLEGDYDATNGQKIYQRVKAKMAFARNNVYDFGIYDCSNTTLQAKTLSNVVDLGLPSGTLWATRNISEGSREGTNTTTSFVSNPTDVGGYFAWGEIATKSGQYIWGSATQNYKYGRGASVAIDVTSIGNVFSTVAQGYLSRYNSSTNYQTRWFDSGNTPPDYVRELAAEDDVAYLTDNKFCMPLYRQAAELLANTSRTKDNNNPYTLTSTVSGYTDRKIVLPAGGYKQENHATSVINWTQTPLYYNGSYACYWTKERSSDASASYMANRFDITSTSDYTVDGVARAEGRLIRPVVLNSNIGAVKSYVTLKSEASASAASK